MSFQPAFPGFYALLQGAEPVHPDLPLTRPASEKQIAYATTLARRQNLQLPSGITADRTALSRWIDQHKVPAQKTGFANYPSSKQVAFAERIARLKRNPVPPECFRDRALMARWIDSNKPR